MPKNSVKHLRFDENNDSAVDKKKSISPNKTKKNKKIKKGGGEKTNNTEMPTLNKKMFAKPTGFKWYEEEQSSLSGGEKTDSSNLEINQFQQPFLKHEEMTQIQKTASGLLEADVQAYKAGEILLISKICNIVYKLVINKFILTF
jgi:hypothetical protein